MNFIIVTGLSGAGKTLAINALEDMEYFCIDNLPPQLITKFAQICNASKGNLSKIAIVTDTRGREMFKELYNVLDELNKESFKFKILFLDSSNETLIRRFKETRRKHPLIGNYGLKTIDDAIKKEREILTPIKERADFIIDTSLYSTSQLKENISNLFLNSSNEGIIINCESFGFKYGNPTSSDLVFDVRCLKNPFYIENLRPKTGLDKEVSDFVKMSSNAKKMLKHLENLLEFLIPLYIKEGKSQLTIAFGCTGGKHRSVTFAEHFYDFLKKKYKNVSVTHRDIDKI